MTLSSAAPPQSAPPRTAPSAVAPIGPAWCGAVMGTAILATLLQATAGPVGAIGARALLVGCWALLAVIVIGFARRCRRDPGALTASTATLVAAAQWGMVSMGLLATGSATSAVLAGWAPALAGTGWLIDGVLWALGTGLGLVTALGFAARLVRTEPGEPTTVWGLAVVPPMVSATTGAGLAEHAGALGGAVLVIATVGFALALCLGGIVLGVACHHHWLVAPVPVAASASAWIPLGIVGQSVAAAQLLAAAVATSVTTALGRDDLAAIAHGYGVVMLTAGLPLIGWAALVTVRGFRARMPFTPGWWAMTFPVGTVALGAHVLADGTGWVAPRLLAGLAVATLLLTWSLCAAASLRAVLRGLPGRGLRGRAEVSASPRALG